MQTATHGVAAGASRLLSEHGAVLTMQVAGFALLVACTHAAPPAATPTRGPRTAPFNDVMDRGYALAAFDRAASRGSDAFLRLHPDEALTGRYIAVHTQAGWVVRFGRLDSARQSFLVAFEAVPIEGSRYRAIPIRPPRAESGFTAAAARALDTATRKLRVERPYNVAVLPAPNGNFFVYAYPATDRTDEAFIGGDTRWLVSADGGALLETRVMHPSMIRLPMKNANGRVAAVIHQHAGEELEDSDIAFSIENAIDQIVITGSKAAFFINPYGVPSYFTRNEVEKLLDDADGKKP